MEKFVIPFGWIKESPSRVPNGLMPRVYMLNNILIHKKEILFKLFMDIWVLVTTRCECSFFRTNWEKRKENIKKTTEKSWVYTNMALPRNHCFSTVLGPSVVWPDDNIQLLRMADSLRQTADFAGKRYWKSTMARNAEEEIPCCVWHVDPASTMWERGLALGWLWLFFVLLVRKNFVMLFCSFKISLQR